VLKTDLTFIKKYSNVNDDIDGEVKTIQVYLILLFILYFIQFIFIFQWLYYGLYLWLSVLHLAIL